LSLSPAVRQAERREGMAMANSRQAHERGFHVTVAVDAMTDMNADAHLNSITRIFPLLGETGTAEEIIDLLERTHV